MTDLHRRMVRFIVGAAIGSIAAFQMAAEAPVCTELKDASASDALDYLKKEPSDQKTPCVVFAIGMQTGPEFSASTSLLVARYLDFEDPYFEVMKLQQVHDHPWAPEEKYPAILALMGIGEAAVPSLMEAIGGGTPSKQGMHNAVDTIMDIYGRQLQDSASGVRLLNDANRSAREPAVAARFLAAARDAIQYCTNEERTSCEMVLWDQSGK